MDNMEKMLYGDVEGDADLDAELNALLAGDDEIVERTERVRVSKAPPPKASPAKPKAETDLGRIDRLARQISHEANIDDDPDDPSVDHDEDLLGELDDLLGPGEGLAVDAPPRDPSPQPKPTSAASKDQVALLSERLGMYKKAEVAAKSEGNSSKARRFGRAVTTLNSQLKAAKAGRPVDPDEIPPPCVVKGADESAAPPPARRPSPSPPVREASPPPPPKPKPRPVPPPQDPGKNQPPPVPERKTPPTPPTVAPKPPTPSSRALPDFLPPEVASAPSPETVQMLQDRRLAYKRAALVAKQEDDRPAMINNIKIAKQFDAVLEAIGRGDDVDLTQIPPEPSLPPGMEVKSVPAPAKSTPTAAPKPAPTPITQPKTILEALEQRLSKYESSAAAAKEEGNERKARMMGRIRQQYMDAIRAYKGGRTVELEELPCPPGYPPFPTATAAPPPVAKRPSPSPVASPSRGGPGPTPPKQSAQDQQLRFLLMRQMQFKKAALAAKQAGKIKTAKEFLRQAKGFDQMIAASRSGIPVDIRATPTPPQAQAPPAALKPTLAPSTDDTVEAGWSVVQGSRDEVFGQLEKDLIRQVQTCQANQAYFTRFGDVRRVTEFERLGTGLKRDLVTLRQAAKAGDAPPRFRYEMRTFPSLQSNPDLGEDDFEIGVVRAIQVKLPAGFEEKHAELFVRFEFPYPQDAPQTGKTLSHRETISPAFNERFKLKINRKARQLQRLYKRHGVKLEVYQKGGFMRSDKLLGTCEAKLLPLETKSEFHDSLDLMEGRRPIGGKLEVKLRVREPLVTTTVQEVREKWLVIDAFVRSSNLGRRTEGAAASSHREQRAREPRQPPPLPLPDYDDDGDDAQPPRFALPKLSF